MKWIQSQTLEELKSCGSFKEVRQQIKESLGDKLHIKFRSWKELFAVIETLRNILSPVNLSTVYELEFKPNHEAGKIDRTSLYFHSDAIRFIYALVELDGEARLKELGVNKSHTKNLVKAKDWRNQIAKVIHPDVCKHPKAPEASIKLTQLYEQMTGK